MEISIFIVLFCINIEEDRDSISVNLMKGFSLQVYKVSTPIIIFLFSSHMFKYRAGKFKFQPRNTFNVYVILNFYQACQ